MSYADAISGIESGGNYGILGPVTKSGDRAYGKYQIMGQNIGPWSKEVLGMEISPQQFLENPQLQDALFQGKFGQYVSKYGPEGAAKAWFAGEKGMNNPNATDQLGTSVQGYADKFMRGMGRPEPSVGPPMSLAPPALSAPALPQVSQPAAPMQAPNPYYQQAIQGLQMPPMVAPAPPIPRPFNVAAFNRIPTPAGFGGFSLLKG